ncbi:hypothetical protein [Paenibacillus bovis]|uniref:DUF5668 domain-containing protein n=1 Tax=Paenibacillus bovis TaxID=1616788 RepID=A0A172ZJX0_9BACL|nr:hypothetical protein [Paenibacillus bovis]ANF97712.1 hypothetical protein AR543_17985 [Paenibacillus bovis]
MTNRNQGVIAIFIILAGLVILLGKLGVFAFIGHAFWPLLILLPGVLLQLFYFSRSASSYVLIPAGILTVYGILFFFCNIWGWSLMAYLWPVLLLGITVGLYEYYMVSASAVSRNIGFAAGVLGALSIILLFFSLLGASALYLIALLLIGGGIWMLLSRTNSKRGW